MGKNERYGYGVGIDSAVDMAKEKGLGNGGRNALVKATLRKTNKQHLEERALGSETRGEPIYAEVNHSRWIAECPYCHGAGAINLTDKTFFCQTCFNADIQNYPRPLIVPSVNERKTIEKELKKRKLRGRNWKHGESVDFMQMETKIYEGRK